ncbi:hypothetical protein ACFU6S_06475 [Streptomyces sp. NPDC057456]|uniref:hypothetical protein n=1 Tax=Streptomyces sp. NPDC057456 TaxID=3346139 RepID=UPI0036C24795
MENCTVCGPHDHRNCHLCGLMRHPARVKEANALRRHWAVPPVQRDRRSRTGGPA